MTQKEIYIERLAAEMRSQGTNNWSYGNMADLCDLAQEWDKWLTAKTDLENWAVAMGAAKILNVEIRNYIPKG